MRVGSVIDARFEIIDLAGEGGMGTVYRAVDRSSGESAALKVLRDPRESCAVRFTHEAKVLAGLMHAHVVRYVTHGVAPGGEPYLVMEWLEGQSLAQLLARGALGVEESVRLARLVASALGVAHAQGIVHRDIKPSNLFLVGGSIERVKVLDFGIARRERASTVLTKAGSVVGTPGYMAPEQVRGDPAALDARADVFSLGCVLFECLTGRPPFQGLHVITLLAKLLFDEPPRLRELVPSAPAALDTLVSRMLSKDPQARPVDGDAVVAALDRIESMEGIALSERPGIPEALTGMETRLVSVVVVVPAQPEQTADLHAATVDLDAAERRLTELRRAVKPFGARIEELAGGALVAMVVGAGSATDQATLAARCALRLKASQPDADMVLVTGRSEETRRLPVGELLERAAALMEERDAQGDGAEDDRPIQIDQRTQALLDMRFDVVAREGRVLLRGERESFGARTLLGKPSPFVGREREMRNILELIEGSFDEERAAAVLVTAAAGMGKSRLRYELIKQLKANRPELSAAVGRGDSIAAGSAFGMLGSAFRSVLGIAAGEAPHAQRDKLAAATERFVDERERRRVTEFLGEMIGTPFPDDDRPMLRAARTNASIMADQITAAYIAFVRAVASTRPTLLVLEDLHWGDGPSVKLVDAALRELKDKPFVVIALARPEMHERFPKLWPERGFQEIRLRELPRRAAESLVRATLGEGIAKEKIAAIVDRADGNAFYLEELIRAVAAGHGDSFPETVIGMMEARLAALHPEARRLLRAASVFGEFFWGSAIPLLLGAGGRLDDRDHLAELCAGELLVRHGESRFAGEEQYAFRHALLREAAYATLTERDRALGHKLAGEWLERAGETDPRLLAEHFDRGAKAERAAHHYRRAAAQALEGSDFDATIKLAERGLALGQDPLLRAELWAHVGDAAYWIADLDGGLLAAKEALELARPGSRSACRALAIMIIHAIALRRREALGRAMDRLLHTEPDPDAVAPLAWAFNCAIGMLMLTAQRSQADIYLRRLLDIAGSAMGRDDDATGLVERVRADWARYIEVDPWAALEHDQAAAEHFERAGDHAQLAHARIHAGLDLALLGQFDRAERELLRCIAEARAGSIPALLVKHYRASSLALSGRLSEAEALAERVLKDLEVRGEEVIMVHLRLTLAAVLVRRGELVAAARELGAIGETAAMPAAPTAAHTTVLAELRLKQGRAEEASTLAERASSVLREGGTVHYLWRAALLLVRAEALHATGDHDAARAGIREARDDLLARAAKIPDAEIRRGFLQNLPTHARTLELAAAWLGEP